MSLSLDNNTAFVAFVLIITVGIVIFRFAEAWERRGTHYESDDDELT